MLYKKASPIKSFFENLTLKKKVKKAFYPQDFLSKVSGDLYN